MIKQHWKISLFVILLLPLLVWLGFWQLERAQEKQVELTVYQQRQRLPAIPLNSLLNERQENVTASKFLQYRNVELVGEYERNKYWLIDNQPRMGKTGYEIIMPFKMEKGIVLVNRGWIAAPLKREQLPKISTPSGTIKITGYLYPSQKNAVIQSTASDLTIEWPKRVLQLDVREAIKSVGTKDSKTFSYVNDSSYILRINQNSDSAFTTQWPIINTRPEKHKGYAVQWFSMSIALLALYFWLLFRSR